MAAFVLRHPLVASVVFGVTKSWQLLDILNAVKVELTPEIISEIDKIHSRFPNPCPWLEFYAAKCSLLLDNEWSRWRRFPLPFIPLLLNIFYASSFFLFCNVIHFWPTFTNCRRIIFVKILKLSLNLFNIFLKLLYHYSLIDIMIGLVIWRWEIQILQLPMYPKKSIFISIVAFASLCAIPFLARKQMCKIAAVL